MRRFPLAALLLITTPWACVIASAEGPPRGQDPMPSADCHQHLFSPAVAASNPKALSASDLVALMDEAGIRRALVLSLAYQHSNPNKPAVQDEYAKVMAENDWTSRQVGAYPDRLRGFCSVNPLEDHALSEIARCARDPNLKWGLKLHFGNSDIDLQIAGHVERVVKVFQAANDHRMALVVHLRPSVTRQRPYGAPVAKIFLEQVLPAAPHVPVQIAHLAGAGGYDDVAVDEALEVFVRARAENDTRMRLVYFDVSGVAGLGEWRARSADIAKRIRQLGVDRVMYGSDGAVEGNTPATAWANFRQLPLSDVEFRTIATNSASCMQ